MGNHKTLPFFIAVIFSGWSSAQETSDPVASIITSESEATAVLGGGWPPQNFGNKAGHSVKNILNGSIGNAPKISDAVEQSVKEHSPVKKVDPRLIAQSSPQSKRSSAAKILAERKPVSTPESPAPRPDPKPVRFPAKDADPKQKPSSLLNTGSVSSPLILPLLPEVEDSVLTPSIVARSSRAPRPQTKRARSLYTLGPGDSVSFSAFDRSDLARTVRIAPDGTVSYLQAVAVNANGLTVDELRERMEEELQKYRRDFKLIVSPQQLLSKEFAILGRVRAPGTFPLNRPTTVLEGIALAQGVEIGTIRGSAYGLADFDRSFVSRGGRKLDVDFSALYYEGDLDQNVHLQPNDYLYVASVLRNEFYILGSVNSPGKIKMPNRVTVTQAVSLGGGYLDQAYRMKVLVIRGDIHNPDVRVVNMRDVLKGNGLDVMVETGDIIFVPRRPFQMLERVLDSAMTTYVQTVTAEAVNLGYTPVSN